MKAFILAAGLGTRLKPWTLEYPKALVPVGGVPMLERVILKLKAQGFDYVVINAHHFANQIVDFVKEHDFGVKIHISDESEELLDTGGAILKAAPLLCRDEEPFLVHNVDILSDADLGVLMQRLESRSEAIDMMLVSNRNSSRKLLFDRDMKLRAWHNLTTDEYKPEKPENVEQQLQEGELKELAFSGIHVMRPAAIDEMRQLGYTGKFPIMDFLLDPRKSRPIEGTVVNELNLIDIGKPETLSRANELHILG